MPLLPERTQERSDRSLRRTRPAPSATHNWFDRFLLSYVTTVPGWVVGLTAVAAYGVVGLAVPYALDMSVIAFVGWNMLGTTLAGLVLVYYLVAQIYALRRRLLVEWTTDLRKLTAAEFEWLVSELYRREGYTVIERGRIGGPDGGIDLELIKGHERKFVQCKRWESKPVGVAAVRSFAGALLREKAAGRDGVFVTLSRFTPEAEKDAAHAGLQLIDGPLLYELIENVRRPEPCPACGRGMVLDRSAHGWWFRCIGDGCSGKRHLDADPGRAVDLLTEPPMSAQS